MLDESTIWIAGIICIDLVLAVIAITAYRYFQSVTQGINTTEELSKKDNFAFGIAFAGGALALAQIIAAAVGGDPAENYLNEAINVSIYALLGIVLLRVGALVNDKMNFNQFSLTKEISKENMTAGIIQAANYIALGIIISAAIHWIEVESYEGVLSVLFTFITAQVVLLGVTRYRAGVYAKRHNGASWQKALQKGNPALAIRYLGHIIATALGINAAAHLVSYSQAEPWFAAIIWFGCSVLTVIAISLLAVFARSIILMRINTTQEVDEQQNIGVAFIEAQIFVSMALVLDPLLLIIDTSL
ncbi:MAG: DUF350 domain-containing protein [Gammaproteobacteria bacterium]|jgi:uncharacterized membrane protein YjfL (UPF0719 family)|uniref:DUF350 domain-containing protein n=1 Tax=Methyloprofundus sp. TaxID=2020875 RepID=UPI00183728D7|nr:DUF350 domain-containing protein [Methyloprofundus sp.]MBT3812548.1 DUF350 domain-containing protein [Gammaproteobacteria bacterium]HIL77892.1 DUF350 domain-containing protein [Methylococcales bacterium]MBT4147372.1 DUF350 domain-containing protein [Gammaproteobacteria bacterium]MBT5223232.1 DUF350 domain-containing protein [Gammaproteobacteria bacterium]MBT5824752.1 DUF350 domain-containing protein [Gammaproteobacteria bacterium]